MYASKRRCILMAVKINGKDFKFSAGKHNELQKAIIKEFAKIYTILQGVSEKLIQGYY